MNRVFDTAPVGTGAVPSRDDDLLNFSPDVICTVSREGRLLRVSAAAQELWGYEPGSLTGKSLLDLVAADDQQVALEAWDNLLNRLPVKGLLNQVRCRDGQYRPTIWSARWNPAGEVAYCIARDGGERQEAQQKSKEYEHRAYKAYKQAGIGWWEWLADSRQLLMSDELFDIYGLARDGYPCFTIEDYLKCVYPEDLSKVLENIQLVHHSPEQNFQYEHRMVKPSGELIYVIHYIGTERDAEGRLLRCHGTTRDITARKTPEIALRRSRQRLEDIVESLGDGFFALDQHWIITYWNRKAELVTHQQRDQMVGRDFWQLFPHAMDLKFYSEFTRAISQRVPVRFEEYSPLFGCWMEVSAYPSEEGLSVFIKDISARKRDEEERRQLNEQLKKAQDNLLTVLESMSDGFYTLDRHWNITFATDRMAAMLGVKKEDYIGKNYWQCFPENVHRKFYAGYHRAFSENTLVTFEEYVPTFDIWVEVSAYPHDDELSIYVKDITDRKRQEQELRTSHERFELVCKATQDVIWDWNVENGEMFVNDSFTRTFGYDPASDQPLYELWVSSIYEEDRHHILRAQQEVLHNPEATFWEVSYRFVKACGELAYVDNHSVIIRNEEGKALRMVGAVKDVTEQKRQEKRLEFMAKATSEVIWERRLDSEEVAISGEKMKLLFGYEISGSCMLHSFWVKKIHPDDLRIVTENREYALQYGLDFYINEYRFQKADGSWAYVKDRTYFIRNEEGKTVAMTGAMEDVTRQRLAEKALVESEKTYRQFFDNAPSSKLIIEIDTLRIRDVNKTAIEHYGYRKEEFTQMTVLDIRPVEDRAQVSEIISRVDLAGHIKSGPIVHLKKDGTRILVEVSITPVDFKGKRCYLASVTDVTEKIKLQEALLREKINFQKGVTKAAIEAQEKERSEIGRELHDNVNQILASAKLYVESINYYPGQGQLFIDKGVSLLQQSINEIRRLSQALVTPTISDVGFRETVRELADSYRDLHLFEVVSTFQFEEKALGKELKLTLYRILQESFHNTVKYAKASLVQIRIDQKGQLVHLDFSDNGIGFDPQTIKRGIGLANIQNRADAYQGAVELTAAPGKGCRLRITFPLNQ